ncbi:MAG TPA: DUF3043 domain-containing protein [Streptosporangiaceae bacterium]|nr:DUF3043 domain-containing protein [Streptosporangiaceae bacterium]
MFRRRSSDAPEVLDESQAAPDAADSDGDARPARSSLTAPKGVPTPKRSEAQASRRQPYQAPADRKTATQRSRQLDRSERVRKSQALQRGEQWALPAKDRGQVRGLARDVVDARRGIGEWYMLMVVLLVVLLVVPGKSTKIIADVVVVALLLVVIVEAWLVGNKVKRLAAERFPNESTKGVVWYAAQRGIQLRRMRLPKPRVERGQKI